MAMTLSPSTPVGSICHHKPNGAPKTSLSLQTQGHQATRSKVLSWGAASNYANLEIGVRGYTVKPILVQSRTKRAGVLRCATIEEIEAEKSMIEKDVKERMEKTIETVRTSFSSIRTGRANPAMLDKIEVEYYGTPVSLKSIAQISTPDASSLLVQPYDKSSLKVIEKAIVSSDLGMTPNNDGEVIRLTIPQLTSERRKELSKIVAKQAEEGKVAIRNIRRDAIKSYEKLQKEKKLSEDNVKDLSSDLQDGKIVKGKFNYPSWPLRNLPNQLYLDHHPAVNVVMQKVTDEYMKKIESIYKQKEKELLTV